MKRICRFIALLGPVVLTTALTSCAILWQNPLDAPPGTSVDPTPYLGEWDLVDTLGLTEPSGRLEVAEDAGELMATFTGEEGAATYAVDLTTVLTDTVVASVRTDVSTHIVGLSLANNGNRLVVTDLNPETVMADVQSGALAGRAGYLDSDHGFVSVTASGSDVRAYIEANPEIFWDERSLIFDRAGGGAGAFASPGQPGLAGLGGRGAIALTGALGILTLLTAVAIHGRRQPGG